MILNLGGARPNELDKGTLGHPGRFSYCIGEDEENSPWTPLHVERGCAVGDSAVTAFGGEALRLVNINYNSADAILGGMVDTLACSGIFNASNITGRSTHILVFAKEHRDVLSRAGRDKRRIREYIAENTVISDEAFRRDGGESSGPLRLIDDPDPLWTVAAGRHAWGFAGVTHGVRERRVWGKGGAGRVSN